MSELPNELTRFRAYRSDLPGYMERWILQTPWGTLRLHHILRSDDDRQLHDHPWAFWSLLLTGGYREFLPGLISPAGNGFAAIQNQRYWPRFSIVRHSATDAHRLELTEGPVWTLVWTGPFQRQWGFWLPEKPPRWVSYREWRELHPEKAWADIGEREDRDAALDQLPRVE